MNSGRCPLPRGSARLPPNYYYQVVWIPAVWRRRLRLSRGADAVGSQASMKVRKSSPKARHSPWQDHDSSQCPIEMAVSFPLGRVANPLGRSDFSGAAPSGFFEGAMFSQAIAEARHRTSTVPQSCWRRIRARLVKSGWRSPRYPRTSGTSYWRAPCSRHWRSRRMSRYCQ